MKEIKNLQVRIIKVQSEEQRMFNFLHGLGEAFSGDLRPRDLHRLIVEGAVSVIDAHGGALYLANRANDRLIPAFLSKDCPPVVVVPMAVKNQADSIPAAIESHIRMHSVRRGDELLGSIWEHNESVLIASPDEDPRLMSIFQTVQQTASVMVAPLTYRGRKMGVLALANGPIGRPFVTGDFDLFRAIAEQSAFALYSAKVYIDASEKQRMDSDLQTANEIQSILLPSRSPQIDGYEISGTTLPARYVSGDYFDYIKVNDTHTGIVIADVSGKGVAASLIMAMCRSVLRAHATGCLSPAETLRIVNRQIYPDIREDMFISLAYVILDHETGAITLARAGHDAPILYTASNQNISRLNPRGMAIGVDGGDLFDRVTSDFSVNLQSGDCLLLYTDGVTEAVDANEMEFGLDRMKQSVQVSARQGAEVMLSRLVDDVKAFAGDEPQADDLTIIAIRKTN